MTLSISRIIWLSVFFAPAALLAGTQSPEPTLKKEFTVDPLEQHVSELQYKFRDEIEKTRSPELIALTRPALAGETAEVLLRMDYAVHCTGDAHFVAGRISYEGRVIRTLFFEGTEVTEVGLSHSPSTAESVQLEILPNPQCSLVNFDVSLDYTRIEPKRTPQQLDIDFLAIEHSPFMKTPDALAESLDAAPEKSRSLPMALGYHAIQGKNGEITLVYTLYLSNDETDASIEGRYQRDGVAPKMQLLYAVTLDISGTPIKRSFQIPTGSHAPQIFLDHSTHPVIELTEHRKKLKVEFGITQAESSETLDGFQLVPRVASPNRFRDHIDLASHRSAENRIRYPRAREWLLFQQPWMLRAADLELKESGKLPFASDTAPGLSATDFLFVIPSGKLKSGKLRAILDVTNPECGIQQFSSAEPKQGVDTMGKEMWGFESVLALPVGRALLSRIQAGECSVILTLVPSSGVDTFDVREPPRMIFFRENGRVYNGQITDPSLELTRRFHLDPTAKAVLVYHLGVEDPSNP